MAPAISQRLRSFVGRSPKRIERHYEDETLRVEQHDENEILRVKRHYENEALRPLPSKQHIRLLQIEAGNQGTDIRCALSVCHVDMLSHIEYYALSYKWDQPSIARDFKTLNIDGRKVHVQSTLISFLHNMTLDRFYHRIFIDAICINQQNHAERDAQVNLMVTP